MRIALVIVLSFTAAAAGQDFDKPQAKRFSDIASVETSISPKQVKPGSIVTVTVTIVPMPEIHTYPTKAATGQSSLNKFGSRIGELIVVKPPSDPPGLKEHDGAIKGTKEVYYEEPVNFTLQAVVPADATPGKKSAKFDGTALLACGNSCFTAKGDDIPPLEYEVIPGSVPISPEHQQIIDTLLNPNKPKVELASDKGLKRKEAKPVSDYQQDLDAIAGSLIRGEKPPKSGLLGLLAAAVVWGLISLVTPCVFPMIPITVSLFLKQAHQSTAGAVKYAMVYCLTIVVVIGLAAVLMLGFFRALSVSPTMNVLLGILLFVFALSLFGLYDIQLPSFLLRATEKRRAGGGLVGTIFGALAFSIVSFTCVAPFLGGFASLSASGSYSFLELLLAGFTFAAAFASPFFILALFPSMLKKMPRSGGWLDTVKAVMGFLELAAAFKFLRTAELRWPPAEYFTFDIVLAAWVVISLACGLYLLGVFRLPHDDEAHNLGVLRLLFALSFLGLGVHLAPGLMQHRPSGVVYAWVEAFLLPEAGGETLPWSADLKTAIEEARKEKSLVFIDFTGVTCTNCKYNEHFIFPVPGVHEALSKFKLVQLYTDDVPADFYRNPPPLENRTAEAEANLRFQEHNFDTQQLPLYVILEPLADGKIRVAGVYREGKINDKDGFLKFLTKR